MKENRSSLWSPSEEIKNASNLMHFCKHLDKKKLLKFSDNYKNLWKWCNPLSCNFEYLPLLQNREPTPNCDFSTIS